LLFKASPLNIFIIYKYKDFMDFQNTLFTNDNLFVLYGLNSEIADLIYLDPPFNSKRTYSAPIGTKSAGASFKDMWTWDDVNEAYLDKLAESHQSTVDFINSITGAHSRPMKAYITYMTQRLIELHRILKPTGSIYLHCDPTASHYLKIILDNIFGKSNFRNEIIWQRNDGRAKGSQHKAKKFGANTDTIFFYTKSDDFYFNNKVVVKNDEKFNKVDKNGRRYYTGIPIFRSKSMGPRPNLCYEWRGFSSPYSSGWRLSKERLEEEYQKGNVVIKDGKLERRKYEDEYEGVPLDNNWIDIPRAIGKEATGYPTQKPLALLYRIIEASTKEGDLVLDPFCGCATTCVASQQLGRKWMGIDIEKQAVRVLIERLDETGGGLLENDKFVHRLDVPQRTDVYRIPHTEKSVRERLFKEQDGKCKACDVEMRIVDFEVDHIVPKAKGGGDYYENYQLLCSSCNRIKGARPMEYLRMKIKTREKYIKKVEFGE
jgi:DNA modification methylase